MNPFPADDARLRALILHVSLRCGDWPRFDIALLERLLFQADFLHFRLYGFPITGQTYLRGLRSPAPEALRRMVRRMIQSGEFRIREAEMGDGLHVRNIPSAHREPDLRIFDGQEIAVVERVLWFYRQNWTTETACRDLLEIPWELADLWEEIPYALALISGAQADRAPNSMRLLLQETLPQVAGLAGLAGLAGEAGV
ncbi:MAG: hypothetical protein ABIW76_04385 [Fibrobacteria bacterium]